MLPRLSVPESLVRLSVPEPTAVCFMTTIESLPRLSVPSEGVTLSVPSLVRGRSGDFTREMDDLEMGWALAISLEDIFFFTLTLLPFVERLKVDFAGALMSGGADFFLDSMLASLRASLVLSEAAEGCEADSTEFHLLEGGRGGKAAVKVVDCLLEPVAAASLKSK